MLNRCVLKYVAAWPGGGGDGEWGDGATATRPERLRGPASYPIVYHFYIKDTPHMHFHNLPVL